MTKLPTWFLIAATASLLVGIALRLHMGMSHGFHQVPAHGQLYLAGWVSLVVIGLTYRGFPELARQRAWALAQFALASTGAIAFPVGVWMAIDQGWLGLAILAAVTWFVGVMLFFARLLATGLAEPAEAAPEATD